ncbi:MAG: TIGR03905 family TSCPD domain-containing protein [Clostridia bacterium]
MHYIYKTKGTCSSQIEFDINGGVVTNTSFRGGCNGNLQGIGKLIDGMKAQDIIAKCAGIKCGWKSTSCPDQLAIAITQALSEENK